MKERERERMRERERTRERKEERVSPRHQEINRIKEKNDADEADMNIKKTQITLKEINHII